MAMSNSLRNKLIAVAGGGAMAIATVFLGGKDGVEGRVYEPYKDVAGVWTVCDGHTGTDIIKGRKYTDRECDRLMWNDLKPVKKTVDSLVKVPLGEYPRAALYSFTYNVGNRAGIIEAKKVAADAESSVAQLETDVVAQFAQQQAAIQEKMTAYTDANGGSAIYTLKAGVKYGGANYDAGMSVAVTINGSEVTTRFAVNANQFVVASGSGNNVYSPFIIKDGQVLISQAFIGEGWITNAMIGNYIQSNNYVAGATGWMLSKSGIYENNGYEPGNGRMVQTNNQISVYDGNGVLRVRMGKLS